MTPRLECAHCGQDWLYPYRIVGTGREFLLCPECESVWLPGQDTGQGTDLYLGALLEGAPRDEQWNLIEALG